MADVFISYRRADAGWAGRLANALQDRYDTFFDTDTIETGAVFPEAIGDALDTARILIAVIGPLWVTQKYLKRLSDPDDWVRKEILHGLERSGDNGVHLLPVLIEDVSMPSADQLPEVLRPLASINAYGIEHRSWRRDLDQLMHTIDGWLWGQSFAASARTPLPPVVPHLCNRIPQEDELIDFFNEPPDKVNVSVVILHGHKWEEHYGFVDRLRYRRLLEELFRVGDKQIGIALHNLQWNVDGAAQGKFEKVLLAAVKRHVLEAPMASRQEIRTYFRSIPQPHVLVLQVAWADYERCGDGLMEGIISAWRRLFGNTESGESHQGLKPPHPAILWINLSYEDDVPPLDFQNLLSESSLSASVILPPLPAIDEGHIQRWIAMDEVKHHIAGMEGRILSLVENENRCFQKGRLHMRRFVEGIQEILV